MFLGIDIGGTNVKFGAIDENYNIIKKYSIPTGAKRSADEVLSDIIEKAREISHEFSVELIGIGCPGRIDQKNGICVSAGNLPFANVAVASIVERALDIPASLANDARCAVCGELYAGAGRGYDSFVMMTLGTGVGGGIVINKKMHLGKAGNAGEIGHIIIDKDGVDCKCGQRGCFEHYASVTALIKQTESAAKENPESLLAEMCADGATGRTAFDAKKAGCPVGTAVVDKFVEYIAMGIMSVARVLQPDAVVIGGAISNEGDNLILPLREKTKTKYHLDIIASELKNDAGLIGAVAMAREVACGRVKSE